MTKFLNISTDTTLGGASPSDETVSSQKAIKAYVDSHGGGGSVAIDGLSITKNGDDELQTVGVIDNRSGNAIKTWTGTKVQYDAITTKDSNTLYSITDDTIDTAFADTSLSNITSAGKETVSGLVMPSSTYDDLTLGASGASYTAPANGWFCVGGFNGSAGTGSVTIRSSLLRVVSNATNNEWGCSCVLPVKKGDVVYIDYKNITTWLNKFFIYAEGEQ